jgi:two-component system, cell cycle sensor histidine kinase and response regulator CckA
MPLSDRLSKFRSSFQFKLFWVFTLLTALISFLFSSLYIVSEIRESRANVTEQVRLLTHHLADSIRLPLYAENRGQLQELAEAAARSTEILAVVMTAADGKVLVDFRHPPSVPTKTVSYTAEVRSIPLGVSIDTALTGGTENSGALLGSVRLERGTSDLSRRVAHVVLVSCSMAVTFWFVISLLSYLVLQKVTRSFNALVRGVQLMQTGDYTSRIEVNDGDEPGRAAQAINVLADTLLQRDEENLRLNQELVSAMRLEVQSKEMLASLNRSLELENLDRIRAEQIARQGEQTLRNLMDVMPVGVVWTDLEGTVEYINLFFTERFGYGIEEIRTLNDWFLFAFPDPIYRKQIVDTQQSAIGNSDTEPIEIPLYDARITCKDDSVRHVLIKNQTARNRRIVIIIDVTDRELLHEQLIKTQKLESLGVLAGGIAHNFNNVLTGVMGYISFAHKFLDESHKAYMPLQHAEDASRRAAGMAKQLLTFARGGDPVKTPVSVRKIILESVSLALNGSNVQSKIEMPLTLHSVMADEGQLSQVFNNIIINAVQAMPKGGTLTVCAENVTLHSGLNSCFQQMHQVKISFTDEGCGIPAENLKKIFDPYYTTKSIGTGLGLASAYSIVSKHGGQIIVDSVVGKGTAFTIMLPATGNPNLPAVDAGSEFTCSVQGSGSILVMDDEEMIRELIKDSLESLGYQVTTCVNGDEAVASYNEAYKSGKPFAAVILDLTVQHGMGGQDAAQHILTLDPQAILIVSSGYSFNPVMAEYKNFGFRAAVTKPYKFDELGRQLGLLLVRESDTQHAVNPTAE